MQFGRIHGIALIVLGLILIALQVDLTLANKRDIHPPVMGDRPVQMRAHGLGPLAGFVGGASLIAGFAIFFTTQWRDEPDPKNAIK